MLGFARTFFGIFFALAFATLSSAQEQSEMAPTPSAEQVMLYVETINSTPATDREEAIDVLDRWLGGELQMSRMDAPEQAMGEGEVAACLLGCCTLFGCNPACVAGCSLLK